MAIPRPAPRSESTTSAPTEEYQPRSSGPLKKYEPVEDAVTPISSADLLDGPPPREFILIGGKDGSGKSSAIVSQACVVAALNPDATFYVIDSENKMRSAMRSFGTDAPQNIRYFKVDNMNQVTWAVDHILREHKPGDWLGVESMSRIWERAQDLGYMAVSGYTKVEYMERRREQVGKKAPATPQPDQLWSVTKGAHDSAFLDLLTQSTTLNVIMSTIIAKPPKEGAFMRENQDRRALRAELGIDAGLEGSPRLPYYVETLCLLDVKAGQVTCRILRDNLSTLDNPRVEFPVADRKQWGWAFQESCRAE